jgi:adenine phosphoribosyltransferase
MDNTLFNPLLAEAVRASIPVYPDWPKPGINYLNTVELCANPVGFNNSVRWFSFHAGIKKINDVFAADARGFIWGSVLANRLMIPMHTVRKPGKLPGDTWKQTYELEYGTDTLELMSSVPAGNRPVMIVDDVLATGGTAEAICKLLHNNLGIEYASMTVAVLVNIVPLGGEQKLRDLGVNIIGMINE